MGVTTPPTIMLRMRATTAWLPSAARTTAAKRSSPMRSHWVTKVRTMASPCSESGSRWTSSNWAGSIGGPSGAPRTDSTKSPERSGK